MNLAAGLRALILAACLPAAALAQAASVAIGMTVPLTGPDAAFGLGLRDGAQLAVARANAAGGVAGHALELVVLDDGGDPGRAAANTRQLLRGGALAITGSHGAGATAAVAAVLMPPGSEAPLAALVAPATSAEQLRTPARPGVFHLRAGTAEQASAALLHLDTLGVTQYAVLAQGDALGESGLEWIQFELTRIATRPSALERLPAGAQPADVQRAMARLCAAKPEALILAVDAVLAAQALNLARQQRCTAQQLVFSETGAALAARAPGARGSHPFAGLLVTQVVPHPQQVLHPLVSEYRSAMAAQESSPGSHASLEGYLALRVIHEALRGCAREPDRKCLLQALGSRSFDLPGLKVHFGSAQRQSRPFVEINMLDAEGRLRH